MGLVFLIASFMIVVAIDSVAVYSQRKFKAYTNIFGKHDWQAHLFLLFVIWTYFLVILYIVQMPRWELPSVLRSLSILMTVIGLWLVYKSWIRLGTSGVCNGWFFNRGPKKPLTGGIYKLRNPMYTGFAFLFIGAGFWLKNSAYLWMALISFVLLNLIQARIEKP